MKTYYKVVTKDLWSVIDSLNLLNQEERKFVNSVKLQYSVGSWIFPRYQGTSLMVFNSLQSAKCFHRAHSNTNRIFEVQVKNPRRKGIFTRSFLINIFFDMIKKKFYHKKYFVRYGVPNGTIFVDAVKLVKEVV